MFKKIDLSTLFYSDAIISNQDAVIIKLPIETDSYPMFAFKIAQDVPTIDRPLYISINMRNYMLLSSNMYVYYPNMIHKDSILIVGKINSDAAVVVNSTILYREPVVEKQDDIVEEQKDETKQPEVIEPQIVENTAIATHKKSPSLRDRLFGVKH